MVQSCLRQTIGNTKCLAAHWGLFFSLFLFCLFALEGFLFVCFWERGSREGNCLFVFILKDFRI